MISHQRSTSFDPAASPSRRRARRLDREAGTALVELGLVMPLLVLLLFGIIDFGWTFSKLLDVQHGAREGSRLIAVNHNPNTTAGASQADDIATEICRRMGGAEGVIVTLRIPSQSGSVGRVGQSAEVDVSRSGRSLTGLFGPILNGQTLDSEVSTRIEVRATWASGYGTSISKVCPA